MFYRWAESPTYSENPNSPLGRGIEGVVEIIVGLKAQPTLCFWGKNQDFVTLNSFQGLSNIVSLQSMCYL